MPATQVSPQVKRRHRRLQAHIRRNVLRSRVTSGIGLVIIGAVIYSVLTVPGITWSDAWWVLVVGVLMLLLPDSVLGILKRAAESKARDVLPMRLDFLLLGAMCLILAAGLTSLLTYCQRPDPLPTPNAYERALLDAELKRRADSTAAFTAGRRFELRHQQDYLRRADESLSTRPYPRPVLPPLREL